MCSSTNGGGLVHPFESAELWRRLEPWLDAVLDATPEERRTLLDRLAATEPTLVPLLTPLLEADATRVGEHALEWLVPDWRATADDAADSLAPGARIGAYRVVSVLGRGGMGEVYLAERADGAFAMPVALKLGRPDARLSAAEVARRLVTERQLLARLSHRNIARLLDGGVAPDGRPFLAMELVDGVRITEHARSQALDRRARLRLFLQVCRAVQHAHSHLVVHGDLKPANVLVTADGTVKLLDFGVATALGAHDDRVGFPNGTEPPLRATLAYASPEQLRGEPVSTASDVFSLGVLLCELLELPRPDDDAPPTAVRLLPADLQSLLRTALAHEPAARYRTVEALGRDVQAVLDGDVVLAHPTSAAYRIGRLVGRHRPAVALFAVLLVTVVGFGLVAVAQARRLERTAEVAAAQRDRAVRANGILLSLFGSVSPYSEAIDGAPTPQRMLDSAVALIEREQEGAPEAAASLLSAAVEAYHGVGDWTSALRVAREAVEAARRVVPPDTLALGWHLLRLGLEESYVGRGRAGEAALREALAVLSRSPEPGGRPEARARNALAVHLARRGFGHDAVEHAQRALQLDASARPVDSVLLAQSYRTLGHALRAAGAPDAARGAYATALSLTEAAFGGRHAETGNALINLGVAMRELSSADSAVVLIRSGLSLRRERLGTEHPDLAIDERQLAEALLATGAIDSAAFYIDRAVALLSRRLPGSLELAHARRVQAAVAQARPSAPGACDHFRALRRDLVRDSADYDARFLSRWDPVTAGCAIAPQPR